MKTAFLQEVTLMSVLHHENIIELLAVSTEEEPYGMIFEFMTHGDLNQFLRKYGPYGLNETESKNEEKGILYNAFHDSVHLHQIWGSWTQ